MAGWTVLGQEISLEWLLFGIYGTCQRTFTDELFTFPVTLVTFILREHNTGGGQLDTNTTGIRYSKSIHSPYNKSGKVLRIDA